MFNFSKTIQTKNGGFMKKILIIIIIILFLLVYPKDDKTKSTFNEENYEFNEYILTFPNQNVSTNNFDIYFSDLKVIYVEAKIDKVYQDVLKNHIKYEFSLVSNLENIRLFKENIISVLESKGFRKEAIIIRVEGLKLKSVKIYCTDKDITNLSKKIENLVFMKY